MKALNKLPGKRAEIELELTRLREGELRRIDALIEASQEAESRMETQRDGLSDTTLLDSQIVAEHARRDSLLLERAGHASKEMYLRLLVELIDILSADAADAAHREAGEDAVAHSEDEAGADSRGEDAREETDAAAHREAGNETGELAIEHFFRLTRPHYPDGVIVEGKVVSFSDEMVVRYLERVVVEDQDYVIRFKGGVEIAIYSKRHN